ncbi:MAG: hypothetical protein Q4A00_08425, partial [Flavobacteriaceae bacterium]|nr:hypothetical protein [Flavobacteriaceae bacterium]
NKPVWICAPTGTDKKRRNKKNIFITFTKTNLNKLHTKSIQSTIKKGIFCYNVKMDAQKHISQCRDKGKNFFPLPP